MSVDGLITVYRSDTGEKVRIPPHWLDNPDLAVPFRKTPKTRATEQRGRATSTDAGKRPEPGLDTPTTTETPAAGAKE